MSSVADTRSSYREPRSVPALKVARIANGLKQEELAELAGVTRQTVGALEGGGSPRLSTAQALADALGVSVADLFPISDERRPHQAGAVEDRADGRDNGES